MVFLKTLFAGWLALTGISQAAVITFDLRNLGQPMAGGFGLQMEGVTLSFSREHPGNGFLVSTSLGIGIDSGYTGEISGLINGRVGAGSAQAAESIIFMFSEDVVIRSVTLAWSGAGVVPVIQPKSSGPSAVVLGNGTTVLPDLEVNGTSANSIYHSGTGTFPAGAGFAIQSITVATIPETSSILCMGFGAVLFAIRRRRC